jgi:hypothetical protein
MGEGYGANEQRLEDPTHKESPVKKLSVHQQLMHRSQGLSKTRRANIPCKAKKEVIVE